jgi:hypothetical protein
LTVIVTDRRRLRACAGDAFLLEMGLVCGIEVNRKPCLAVARDQVLIWGDDLSNRGPEQSLEREGGGE